MGVPYLWGGTSTKGVDCSGFTKTVYFQHGLILPRDASQQVHVGSLVDENRNFSSLEVGDLLFFGRKTEDGAEKVIHVGMWIGNGQFIHASGDVHISSMDSLSDNFDDYNYNRYLRTKRILGYTDKLPASIREIYQSLKK
jgi:cell wall-associated NlpC family hydrolase